jgi:hypothetical protein
MATEDFPAASDVNPLGAPPPEEVTAGPASTPSLAEAWRREGFAVPRPDTATAPAKSMALCYSFANAAIYEKTQMFATVRCACIGGLLFAALAFWLSFVYVAITSAAPDPTNIVFAAILGVILGIIGSVVVRTRYRSLTTYLCTPGHISDTMQGAIARHPEAERYAAAIRDPRNKAGILRGDVVHITHLLRGPRRAATRRAAVS